MNHSRAQIIGRLTRDPELRATQSGKQVASFSIAVNHKGRDDETSYFDCVAWERQAEVLAQYMTKGKPIFVDGDMRQSRWQDKEGNNRSKVEIHVRDFQFLGSRDDQGGQEQRPSSHERAASAADAQMGDIPF